MKTLTKILFQSTAFLAVSFAMVTPENAIAASIPQGYSNDQGNNDQGNGDQGNGDQGNNDQGNNDQGNNDQGNNDQGNNGQGNNDQGNNDQQPTQDQQPTNPTLQVQVQMDLSGKYGNFFQKDIAKFEVFLRGLNNLNDSTKGTKPVRIPIEGGTAEFDDKAGDQPIGLLVALAKKGNTYQHLCTVKNVNNGIIKGFPQTITIKLTNDSQNRVTKSGLRNDSYPDCEVQS